MKSFTALAFIASIALVGAQVTYNNGTFHCAIPDAAYCASDSLSSNIIIRCTGYIGYPGNCNDNLDGEFPFGVTYAPCFQTSDISGDAACTKNCIIYGASGNYNGSFTVLPNCIPEATSTRSISSKSSTSSSSNTITITPITTTTTSSSSNISITTITNSNTSTSTSKSCTHHTNRTIHTRPTSSPTTHCPHSNTSISASHFIHPTAYHHPTLITLTTAPASASSGGPPKPSNNGTTIIISNSNSVSPTRVPVGPTTASGPVIFKGAAGANRACAGLAVVGFVFAVLL